jgi:hypothetical protein
MNKFDGCTSRKERTNYHDKNMESVIRKWVRTEKGVIKIDFPHYAKSIEDLDPESAQILRAKLIDVQHTIDKRLKIKKSQRL